MPTARTFVHAITALCLLLQPALAPVAMATMAPADIVTQSDVPPCHGGEPQAQPESSCCPDECRCIVACGGGFALIRLTVTVTVAPAAASAAALPADAVLPAHTLTLLRPPITLQS